jgi:tetratricopeptide (TPR) repeat protein
MRKLSIVCVLAVATWPGVVRAIDTVRVSSGTAVSGKVTEITPLKVTVEKGSAVRLVPVNEILSITFEGEPNTLRDVRANIKDDRFDQALSVLEKIDAANVSRKEIVQDLEFYKAFCNAKLALVGQGSVVDAGKAMNAFIRANADSYHFLEANEVVGDLLVANQQYGPAEGFYAKLAAAPWPDYKMRAGVAMARALMAQGKWPAAAQALDGVLAIQGKTEAAEAQRGIAMASKARCLVQQGKADEAVKLVNELIEKTDSDQVEVQAVAYNALGAALRKAKRDKDAIFAFLHVDLLYNSVPDAHAEALSNLAELWRAVEEPDRAKQADAALKENYPNSPWARK